MRLHGLLLLLMLSACGGRTDLGTRREADAGPVIDATVDSIAIDSGHDVIEVPDVLGVQCTQGILTEYSTAECGGDQVDWFATPYTPPSGIWVDRIEAHMAQGNVALLASTSAGEPGAVLFPGSVGTSPTPAWIGADVSPPVYLQPGVLYYVGFQGDCSFASNGPEPVEYMASSINGPWHVQGTDNWTARLIGTCP